MLLLAGSVGWLLCQHATSFAVCFPLFYPIDTETRHNTVFYRLLFYLPVNLGVC